MLALGLLLLLLGCLCALLAVVALLVCLGASVAQAVISCIEHVLENLNTGHVIIGLLYLIPTALLICAIGEMVYLAHSFITTVFK